MSQFIEFLTNHWPLWAALFGVVALIVLNEWQAQKQQAGKISPHKLVALMNHDDIPVYDLRPKEAFRDGHIVGASQADKDDFNKAPLNKLKDKPFALVCDNGIRSGNLGSSLKKEGFTQVMVLNGGMRAWQENDLPTVKGK